MAKSKTRERLLDVAERHFAEFGFSGTSVRSVMTEAEANVAAVHYYFGSKEDLFQAVLARFGLPVMEAQLRALESLQNPGLEDLVRAFYSAPLQTLKDAGPSLGAFLGRCQTEPEPVRSLVERHFAPARDAYVAAMRHVTGWDGAEAHWRFEMVLGLLVTYLTRRGVVEGRVGVALGPERAVEWLLDVACRGIVG